MYVIYGQNIWSDFNWSHLSSFTSVEGAKRDYGTHYKEWLKRQLAVYFKNGPSVTIDMVMWPNL